MTKYNLFKSYYINLITILLYEIIDRHIREQCYDDQGVVFTLVN